jgi:large conductance mechanosensitive channel
MSTDRAGSKIEPSSSTRFTLLNTAASIARTGTLDLDKMDKASEKKKGFVKEFVDFLQTFGVIGLAIGFVIGVASSAVVNSLVKDLINPIVGLVLPTGNLSSLNATVTSPVSNKPSVFLYGDFISQVIYFIIIALVVFLMYKQLKRMGLAKM